jgi:hypothetical protein
MKAKLNKINGSEISIENEFLEELFKMMEANSYKIQVENLAEIKFIFEY